MIVKTNRVLGSITKAFGKRPFCGFGIEWVKKVKFSWKRISSAGGGFATTTDCQKNGSNSMKKYCNCNLKSTNKILFTIYNTQKVALSCKAPQYPLLLITLKA